MLVMDTNLPSQPAAAPTVTPSVLAPAPSSKAPLLILGFILTAVIFAAAGFFVAKLTTPAASTPVAPSTPTPAPTSYQNPFDQQNDYENPFP